MNLEIGQLAPEFALPDQGGQRRAISDYRGQWVVLYFYPKDDTPGCTTEACQMRDLLPHLADSKAIVLGVSVDSVKSHKKFDDKYTLSFPLLADEDKDVVERYGVWAEKSFVGKKYMGVNRTTFIINPESIIAKIYEQVKPEGHAEVVIQDLKQLQQDF